MTSLLLACVPVVLGLVLALTPRRPQVLGPLRTFAFASAGLVLVAELFPASGGQMGPITLGLFALGWVVPALVDRLAHGKHHGPGVELAFVGLLGHQVIEGLQIGALGHLDGGVALALALSAHTAPLVAVSLLGFVGHDGRKSAAIRGVVVVALTAAGVAGGGSVDAHWVHEHMGWLQAVLAGMLIHLLTHDLRHELPRTPGWRWADLAASLLGILLPLWLLDGHSHGPEDHGHEHASLGHVLMSLGAWVAPLGLMAIGLGAGLSRKEGPLFDSLLAGAERVGPWVAGVWLVSSVVLVSSGAATFEEPPMWALIPQALLVLLFLPCIFRKGLRGWVASAGLRLTGEDEDYGHDHAHHHHHEE